MGRAVDFVDFVDGEIADSFKNYLSFPFTLTEEILLLGKKKGFVWEEWLIWVFDRGKQKPQLFVF